MRIILIILSFLFLTGCVAKNSNLPTNVVQRLGVQSIHVQSQIQNSALIGYKVNSQTVMQQLKTAVREQTRDINGPRKVKVHIVVTKYFLPNLGGDLVGFHPMLNTTVTILDIASNQKIVDSKKVLVNQADFDGGNWMVVHSFGKESDKKYADMIGLYSRKFRKWLLSQHKEE